MNQKILFYDGDCGLCNATVQFILNHEKDEIILFCALQSEKAIDFFRKNNFPVVDFSTVLFYEEGILYQKSSAVLKIMKYLKVPYRFLVIGVMIPRILRDAGYDFVAKNRYKWKANSCSIHPKFSSDRIF